jgi:nucleoside-diphosphate-sugar epimerase
MAWLVTGIAGFIGSHLAEELIRASDQVIGVDAFTSYYPER